MAAWAALPLSVDGIEDQGGFSGTGQAGDHHQLEKSSSRVCGLEEPHFNC